MKGKTRKVISKSASVKNVNIKGKSMKRFTEQVVYTWTDNQGILRSETKHEVVSEN